MRAALSQVKVTEAWIRRKRVSEFAYCQKVQCKRPQKYGEEDRGQIMKTLMAEFKHGLIL